MIEGLNDYEEVQATTGEREELRLGGHVCVIKQVNLGKSKNGKDMMIVYFDIASPDAQAGYFERKTDIAKQFDPKATWKGVHRVLIKTNEGGTNPYFKGFITSIEASNNGYKFNMDEQTLVGKLFGGVFGREEFEAGQFATKIRYVKSTVDIYNEAIPADKLLPKNESAYNNSFSSNTDFNRDDMPF